MNLTVIHSVEITIDSIFSSGYWRDMCMLPGKNHQERVRNCIKKILHLMTMEFRIARAKRENNFLDLYLNVEPNLYF